MVRNPVIIASYRDILGAVGSKQKYSSAENQEKFTGSYARHYLQIASSINELQVPTLYVEHEKALQVPDELADRLSVLLTG